MNNRYMFFALSKYSIVFLSLCINLSQLGASNITGYKAGMPGYFIPVPDNVNFADYHYAGTHNSHVHSRFFTTVRQQDANITEQLNNGTRGLMLDVYPMNEDITNKKFGPGNLVMSHGAPGVTAFSQKGFTSLGIVEYQTLQYELQNVITFLQQWPSEIVVIHLEDYSDIKQLEQDISGTPGASAILFKPSDWDPFKDINTGVSKKQIWPTLGWMRKNNKRLMITTDSGHESSLIWNLGKKYFSSNVWGAKLGNCSGNPICIDYDPQKICTQHYDWEHKAGPVLNYFNNFGSAAVTRAGWDTQSDHLYDLVKAGVQNCQNKGLNSGEPVKSIYTDKRVESINALKAAGKKTDYDYLNELNQGAAQKAAQVEAQAASDAQKVTANLLSAKKADDAKKAADPVAYEKQKQAQLNSDNATYAAQAQKTAQMSAAERTARMQQMKQ